MTRRSGRNGTLVLGAVAAVALWFVGLAAGPAAAQELTPDQKAAMLLASARKAYNEAQFDFAAQRFREFLQTYGGHKDANAARYGLALTLLEGPARDSKSAVDALSPVAGVADFPDRPHVLYYLGLAYRGLGNQSLAEAIAKPNEAPQHQGAAAAHFGNAATQFAAAVAAFEARAKAAPPANPPSALPRPDFEWAARARCDQAEMLLRTNKVKEAAALVAPFTKEGELAKSRYRDLGRYYFGYAAYVQQDFLTAGRTLAQLAPFEDPAFGIHARYLLARVHHLSEERAEASSLYAALLAEQEQQIKVAQQSLQNPAVQNNPVEKARFEALVKGPRPDYIARADFYLGVLLLEQEKPAEAMERFTKFPTAYPNHPLIPESQLRRGYCQVQLKQFQEAVGTLTPLQDHAQLGDRARRWLGRAHVGLANPADQNAFNQNIGAAISHLKTSADRAGQQSAADPEAKLRRSETLLELADAQQSAKQFNEAAGTFQNVVNEKVAPEHVEAAMQRLCTTLHLAGKFPESDNACRQFVQAYPQSPLLAPVLFRYAENAFAVAQAAATNPNFPNKEQQLPALFGEAIKRYQDLLAKFPEFEYAGLARNGLGTSLYRLGKFADAASVFLAISDGDRTGDLTSVPYVLADCLIRTAPENADDAIAAGQLIQQLTEATKLLEAFVAANAKSPLAPDALLKIGHCHQRIAATMSDKSERNNVLATARQAYERVMNQYGNDPAMAVAVFERAKCFASAEDFGTAQNELNRFQGDPLAQSRVAPLALLRLATLLRSQNKPADAVNVLAGCRQRHEGALTNDPTRAAWVPLIQYHHGLALKESGKLPEAQALFDAIAKQFATKTEGHEAAWRAGQCRKDQVLVKLEAAIAALKKPDAKPEEITAANTAIQEGLKGLRDTAAYFESQAGPVGQQAKGSEAHLRMFYEAGWCHRRVAEAEIEAARAKLRDESLAKLKDAAAKNTPVGQPVPPVNAPEIPLASVPHQPAEQLAQQRYADLIAAGGVAPLVQVARLELAEVHAARGEHDPAIALLSAALDAEPPPDLEHKLRLRLGSCHLAKGNLDNAADEFDIVATSASGAVAAEAQYRTAEVQMAKQDWPAAIKTLAAFRDQQPLQNVPGLSDRALLRLGHAYASATQWNESRQAMETLLGRFPQSTWRDEARYGQAFSLQNQQQLDAAINVYRQVTAATEGEVAARAQVQIGLCFLAKKQFPEAANSLLVVPFTYDYPELSGLALCEAARAFVEMKQPQQAQQLLKRVIKEHPTSRWAQAAKERLEQIK
ncbi:MAG: tetratricopeptide repeat protein [Planctomycetia bacterium]|nr:tetratricopeptide repeat protein [Planctomycetia bacterium]